MNKNLVSIALPLPLRKEFTYQLSQRYDESLLGARVRVSFGNQKLVGFLSGKEETSTYPQIKRVEQVLDEKSLFTKDLYDLLCWAAEYYHTPLGKVLETALPSVLRNGKKAQISGIKIWRSLKTDAKELRGTEQQKAFNILSEKRELNEKELNGLGIKKAALRALVKKELVEEREIFDLPQTDPREAGLVQLTQEQRQAVKKVTASCGKFNCFLLEGPTNSGKTEVYIEIIRQMLKQGLQALYMIPEIALSPQTLARLKESLQVPLGLMHSQMSGMERLRNYLLVAQNKLKVVIGTRSTVFIPFNKLGCIIIDEEQDMSYKQDTEFRYNGKHLAIKYAQLLGIPVVLGSATPSLESYHNIQIGRYRHLRLTEKINSQSRIPCRLLDMKLQGKDAPLPAEAMSSIENTLRAGSQVLVFINRRGFAPVLRCHKCGWIQECSDCDRPMTLHKYPPLLSCHICERRQAISHICPSCQNDQLSLSGFGTQRLADALEKHFPEFPVLRIDRDSMRKKSSYMNFYNQVSRNKPCIILGTQIVAKGHDFAQVRLAVLANCDQGLMSPDFHSVERSAQLITQVMGRVGRRDQSKKESRIVLPTYYPQSSTLITLLKQGYGPFADQELKARKRLSFPPYTHFAYLRAEAIKVNQAVELLQSLRQKLNTFARQKSVFLLGPIECALAKRSSYHRRALIIKSDNRAALHSVIEELSELASGSKIRNLRWHTDIDPLEAP